MNAVVVVVVRTSSSLSLSFSPKNINIKVLPEAPEDADTSDTSLYIITCDEDLEYCKDNLAYIPAERFYLPELVLSGALKQELPSDPTIHRFDVTREVDTSKKNLRKKPVTASQQAKKGKK
eukprot:GEZU01039021.1.p1 GENE.GEZU01039021.1~~GEZU01039021.1.p1  ORF type:complete len:121 (+),score=26.41 GEZU01039021.1:37-399(+)